MEIQQYEIYVNTIKNKDKSRNGDYYLFHELDDRTVILAITDGVGSKPCDWLVSKLVCEKFIDKIKANPVCINNKDLIREIVLDIDTEINIDNSSCKGMLSVFSAVVWEKEKEEVMVIHVGDTRIYTIEENQIRQITEDDSKTTTIRGKDNKLQTSGGLVQVRAAITNAIGSGQARVNISSHIFLKGNSLLLATDGFYNCKGTFEKDIKNAMKYEKLAKSFDRLFHEYNNYITDDTTAMILRRNDYHPEQLQNYHNWANDFDLLQSKFSYNILIKFFMIDMIKYIIVRKEEELLSYLTLMEEHEIYPSQEQLEALLSTMNENNFQNPTIYRKIISLLKKSVF